MNAARSSDRADRYKRRNERRLREECAADLLRVVINPLTEEEIRRHRTVRDNVPEPEPLGEPLQDPLPGPKQEPVEEPVPEMVEGQISNGERLVYLSDAYLSLATVLPNAGLDLLQWVPGAEAARNVEACRQLLEGQPECGDLALLGELLTEKVHRDLGTALPIYRCDVCGNWFLTQNGRNNLHVILGLCVDPGHQCHNCDELFESAASLENHECFFRTVDEANSYFME